MKARNIKVNGSRPVKIIIKKKSLNSTTVHSCSSKLRYRQGPLEMSFTSLKTTIAHDQIYCTHKSEAPKQMYGSFVCYHIINLKDSSYFVLSLSILFLNKVFSFINSLTIPEYLDFRK
jgi:hypothetical protein